MRHATITILQDNLAHNVQVVKQQAPNAKLLAMVKADAYGHGVKAVIPALSCADGFGVACMAEALAVKACLADNDKRPVVLIEGVFDEDEWRQAIKHNLMTVIHHQTQLDFALKNPAPATSHTATIWLKYNTGMNRLGFDKQGVLTACQALILAGYRVILTSHFACADTPTHPLNHKQITCFHEMLTTLKGLYGNQVQGSLCNSAGIFNFAQCHYDWVRSGIALYGSSPMTDTPRQALGLKAAMSLSAQVMAIHHLSADETVGYGGLWTAKQPSRIGIVSLGYGDGYPRVVNGAYVFIHGQTCAIVGRVAMDMMAVDLTDVTAQIGDTVIFWGEMPSVDDVANSAGTIGYELLCRLTHRPDRVVEKLSNLTV